MLLCQEWSRQGVSDLRHCEFSLGSSHCPFLSLTPLGSSQLALLGPLDSSSLLVITLLPSRTLKSLLSHFQNRCPLLCVHLLFIATVFPLSLQ